MKTERVTDFSGYPEWAEDIAQAGYMFDGHVTSGSLKELVFVVQTLLDNQRKHLVESFEGIEMEGE